MTGEPELRASDGDRERAVERLRDQAVAGRLTLEEFTERMAGAYEARTTGELATLVRDLPQAAGTRRTSSLALSIFGDTELTGPVRLAGRFVSLTLFGDVDLDLRHATLDGEGRSVSVSVFGDVDLYLPEGVEVDVRSVTIFGDQTTRGTSASPPHPQPAVPLVRVLRISLFGDLRIWRVPSALTGRTLKQIRNGLRRRSDG